MKMDANKREVLVEIGYQLGACGVCAHSTFATDASDFGTCGLHKYAHLKHTGDFREVSVHRCGRCPMFQVDPMQNLRLHRFGEFVP